MGGPRLEKEKRGGQRPEVSPHSDQRRMSRWGKWFGAALAGLGITTITNINHAQEVDTEYQITDTEGDRMEGHRVRRRPRGDEEIRSDLQRSATRAAEHFRNYILGGDDSERQEFQSIYRAHARGEEDERQQFYVYFDREVERHREENEELDALIGAYRTDLRGGVYHPTEFLERVHRIRSLISADVPERDITQLARRLEDAWEAVRVPLTGPLASAWRWRRSGVTDYEEAARRAIEEHRVRRSSETQGYNLTYALYERMPAQNAVLAVRALIDFITTGDTERRRDYNRIMEDMPWEGEFRDTFESTFIEMVGRNPTLQAVALAYDERHEGIEVMEFAEMVSNLYDAAVAGETAAIERFRMEHGEDVIDPLLEVTARGMARRSVQLLIGAMMGGSRTSLNDFIRIYDGNFLGRPIVENDHFWDEFQTRYGQHRQFLGMMDLEFRQNIFQVALRDALIELSLERPDTSRIRRDYGDMLLGVLERNIGNMRWMIRSEGDIERIMTRRATAYRDPDATAVAFNRLPDTYTVGEEEHTRERALADTYFALFGERIGMRRLLDVTVSDLRIAGAETPESIDLNRLNSLLSERRRSRGAATLALNRQIDELLEDTGATRESLDRQLRSRERTLETLEENYEDFAWLSGLSATAAQEELVRRATAEEPDALAVALRSALLENAGTVLSELYGQLSHVKAARAEMVTRYGDTFVDFVSDNFAQLRWLIAPVDDIEGLLAERMDRPEVVELHRAFGQLLGTTAGFTDRTLSLALFDIYAGRDRARLERLYGADLVEYVSSNRAELEWLARATEDADEEAAVRRIEGQLLDRRDEVTQGLRNWMLAHNPVHLGTAIISARRAATRPGADLDNAVDALGLHFVGAVAPSALEELEGEERREAPASYRLDLEVTFHRINGELDRLEESLDELPELAPARAMLEEQIDDWRDENYRIFERGDEEDPEELVGEQRELIDSILTRRDLNNALEMALLMVHMVQTGSDVSATIGTRAGVQRGNLRSHLQWYEGLDEWPSKQEAVGNIVATVLQRIEPEIYRFVISSTERDFMGSMQETYGAIAREEERGISRATDEFGLEFVDEVREQRGHLRVLASVGTREEIFEQMAPVERVGDENELFSDVLIRCYRALRHPREGENRETMIQLFGEEFVEAVQSQLDNLEPLEREANLDVVRDLPAEVREMIISAYPIAHRRIMGGLRNARYGQDEAIARGVRDVYNALERIRPREGDPQRIIDRYNRRLARMRTIYGRPFVDLVEERLDDLDFIPEATDIDQLQERIEALDFAEELNFRFGNGPAAGRSRFMENFQRVERELPTILLNLQEALSFSMEYDQVIENFEGALTEYERVFGETNYHVFNQFFNLRLLGRAVSGIAQSRGIEGVPENIDSPRALLAFLRTDAGEEVVMAGRDFYQVLLTDYSRYRADRSWEPEEEELSDASLSSLSSRLTLIDGLALGYTLDRISRTPSAFSAEAGRALMNSMLVITSRDQYLLAPYLEHVVPALVGICADEETLVAAIEGFNAIFTSIYQERFDSSIYSRSLPRAYFTELFESIGREIPRIVTIPGWELIGDEVRQTAEADRAPRYEAMPGDYYRIRQMVDMNPGFELPTYTLEPGRGITLRPQPTAPGLGEERLALETPFTIESGAPGLYTAMSEAYEHDRTGVVGRGVAPGERIGAVHASIILRRLSQLFGPIPVDYRNYWLNHFQQLGFYAAGREDLPFTGGLAYGMGATSLTGEITGEATGEAGVTTAPLSAEEEALGVEPTVTGVTYLADLAVAGSRLGVGGPDEHGYRAGIHNFFGRFHHEGAERPVEGEEGWETYRQNTEGMLSTYARICRERQVDMLVYVAGTHVPRLLDSEGGVLQAGAGEEIGDETRLQARAYIVTRTGQIFQTAYRLDPSDLFSHLYFGVNTDQVLASLRFVGREMDEQALSGWDGLAVGYAIPPQGSRELVNAGLGVANVLRRITDGEQLTPVELEHAAGELFSWLTRSREQRDYVMALYRGAQSITVSDDNPTEVESMDWVQGDGELVWRRVALDPSRASYEIRGGGGYPGTARIRFAMERPTGPEARRGGSVEVAYSEIDLWRSFQEVEEQTTGIHRYLRAVMGEFHGWEDDRASDFGWSVSSHIMGAWQEEWIPPEVEEGEEPAPEPGTAFPLYATLLVRWWANRHNLVVGGERTPAFREMYGLIDDAMEAIRIYGEGYEESILDSLMERIEDYQESDIWNFVLGYGYDGRRFQARIIGHATALTDALGLRSTPTEGEEEVLDEEEFPVFDDDVSGNLYALFLYRWPRTTLSVDANMHIYSYAPILITSSSEETGGLDISRPTASPYADIYSSFAITTDGIAQRYSRRVVVPDRISDGYVLRDCYGALGNIPPYRERLVSSYGERRVTRIEEGIGSLTWMVRPVEEIRERLQRGISGRNPDINMIRIAHLFEDDPAEGLRRIYMEIRRPEYLRGGSARRRIRRDLVRAYDERAVRWVEEHGSQLGWILLDADEIERELGSRATSPGAERDIMNASVRQGPRADMLTGPEILRMFHTHLQELLPGITEDETRRNSDPGEFDILLGTHLGSVPPRRRGVYYVLMPHPNNPRARTDARGGAIYIGDEQDRRLWRRRGYRIGTDIMRLEIERMPEGGYTFVFSGNRRRRWLSGTRVFGQVTIPLQSEVFDSHRMEHNWGFGALLNLVDTERATILAGGLYGTREFSVDPSVRERFQEWTVTFSGRFRRHVTSARRNELHAYVFFSRRRHEIIFGTEEDRAEICAAEAEACAELGPTTTTTGGIGLTWARVNMTAGDRLHFDFFFEGGARERPGDTGEPETIPVIRGALGVRSVTGERTGSGREWGLSLSGGFGDVEPVTAGVNIVTQGTGAALREQYIPTTYEGWWLMLNFYYRWGGAAP